MRQKRLFTYPTQVYLGREDRHEVVASRFVAAKRVQAVAPIWAWSLMKGASRRLEVLTRHFDPTAIHAIHTHAISLHLAIGVS